jgi:hypothetical protein
MLVAMTLGVAECDVGHGLSGFGKAGVKEWKVGTLAARQAS